MGGFENKFDKIRVHLIWQKKARNLVRRKRKCRQEKEEKSERDKLIKIELN